MIDKLTYQQVLDIVANIRKENEVIKRLLRGRDVQDVSDFSDTIESYCKFLEGTVELNQTADEAIKDLIK